MKKEIDKLAWLYIHDGKLLCARSKNKALFYIPGGKREQGESDQQALIREVQEEISVKLIPASIKYAGIFKAPADGKDSDTIVKLSCYFADFQGELSPDAEIQEIAFISYNNKSLCSLASIKVMDWLKSQNLIG
ncbi:NUDIX hydrolase [Psychromonas sp. MB-3u-54]|uniref:NUDIX hydrolase n=1 Tax=Psychromonas sp. MB-3u-54 TaxID=2058319 RepID=UPI000C3495B2|nr:NUDIX domain-containing protein [Psychromonas sp. MB-3u-54]PKH04039.1 NUDIX hydrolase [Psychromonas sp. MB-3u-54]